MSVAHVSLLALAALAFASAANAETLAGSAVAGDSQANGASAPALGAKMVDESELSDLSGGKEAAINIATSEQNLSAVNSGNTVAAAGSITNGNVTLSSNAFSGFAGIGNFVINTGNNNNLQGSLSVTIVMTPAP